MLASRPRGRRGRRDLRVLKWRWTYLPPMSRARHGMSIVCIRSAKGEMGATRGITPRWTLETTETSRSGQCAGVRRHCLDRGGVYIKRLCLLTRRWQRCRVCKAKSEGRELPTDESRCGRVCCLVCQYSSSMLCNHTIII